MRGGDWGGPGPLEGMGRVLIGRGSLCDAMALQCTHAERAMMIGRLVAYCALAGHVCACVLGTGAISVAGCARDYLYRGAARVFARYIPSLCKQKLASARASCTFPHTQHPSPTSICAPSMTFSPRPPRSQTSPSPCPSSRCARPAPPPRPPPRASPRSPPSAAPPPANAPQASSSAPSMGSSGE